MVALSSKRLSNTRSARASIVGELFSSPVRVFYSILFICALEVRRETRGHAMRGAERAEREAMTARARAFERLTTWRRVWA